MLQHPCLSQSKAASSTTTSVSVPNLGIYRYHNLPACRSLGRPRIIINLHVHLCPTQLQAPTIKRVPTASLSPVASTTSSVPARQTRNVTVECSRRTVRVPQRQRAMLSYRDGERCFPIETENDVFTQKQRDVFTQILQWKETTRAF